MRDIKRDLRDEADELGIKLSKMKGFFEKYPKRDDAKDIMTIHHYRLKQEQLYAMQEYYNTLVLRIDSLKYE